MWEILYDGVVAFLAAVGLVTILWLVSDAIFTRREKRRKENGYGRALHGGGNRTKHHLPK